MSNPSVCSRAYIDALIVDREALRVDRRIFRTARSGIQKPVTSNAPKSESELPMQRRNAWYTRVVTMLPAFTARQEAPSSRPILIMLCGRESDIDAAISKCGI